MYYSNGRRTREARPIGVAEIICILLVVAAVVALVAWIITQAGGGALMT